jgi:hypothetical protein
VGLYVEFEWKLLRGYIWFIILLLITAMLVDITALSETVKNALTTGISVGLGIL